MSVAEHGEHVFVHSRRRLLVALTLTLMVDWPGWYAISRCDRSSGNIYVDSAAGGTEG
jgi:hypothetical protein